MGLVDLVKLTDETMMNVAVRGAVVPQHKIVTISGLGASDFGVYADYITQDLQANNQLIIADRLGTGYSDDTKNDRTVSAVVEEYRTALTKKGLSGPYVLLAHELGSVYATAWQASYPNEIEGVIYVDPNPVNSNYNGLELDSNAVWLNLGSQLGLPRLMYDKLYTPESMQMTSAYTTAAAAFNVHSTYTNGFMYEVENAVKNFENTMNSVQATQVPKMYINCSYAFETAEEARTYVNYENEQASHANQDPVFKDVESAVSELVSNSASVTANVIQPIVSRLGNCHMVKMPGGADIYEQYPGTLKAAIHGFVDYLDGNVSSLQDRYVDRIMEEWQQNQEQMNATEPTTNEEITEEITD